MKCHYVYDTKAGKVLMPGCWAVVISGNMEDCYCRNGYTFQDFEKQQYNDVLKKKNELIKDLERENAALNRIIKKLLKSKNVS